MFEKEVFEFKGKGHKPRSEYQHARLEIVFDVKQDLRRKARLVVWGHLIDILDNSTYSSTVKSISVQMLFVIAHRTGMKCLFGDVGNAFINATTTEKMYTICGPEFGSEYVGQVAIIRKSLYGMRASSACWYWAFSATLLNLGFKPCRHDNDIWWQWYAPKKHV